MHKPRPCCSVGYKTDEAYISCLSPLAWLSKGVAQVSWDSLVELLLCLSRSTFSDSREIANLTCREREKELKGVFGNG